MQPGRREGRTARPSRDTASAFVAGQRRRKCRRRAGRQARRRRRRRTPTRCGREICRRPRPIATPHAAHEAETDDGGTAAAITPVLKRTDAARCCTSITNDRSDGGQPAGGLRHEVTQSPAHDQQHAERAALPATSTAPQTNNRRPVARDPLIQRKPSAASPSRTAKRLHRPDREPGERRARSSASVMWGRDGCRSGTTSHVPGIGALQREGTGRADARGISTNGPTTASAEPMITRSRASP